ncbi:peptidase M48-like protein [Trinickia symbiotica]|uniref:M48 family peptidase n=1 Tax=Trinickia symbiotica TaxID=863227 RepID=A0A2N7X7T5_9BURK|nr:M48 family metallopeptidase [Trinickia symbiotica]PMS37670.1 M48 family peptidase [Trinickia symbiotica]PPK44209.1 peptidase M48-like protein [Trinickia symbiotica]
MAGSHITAQGRPYNRSLDRRCFASARVLLSAFAILLGLVGLPGGTHAAKPSATAGSAAKDPAYTPGTDIHFGNDAMFRNLVPPPILEAQSAVEYAALVERARESGRLLPASDARVDRVRAIAMRLAPLAEKWSDRIKDWHWEVNVVRSSRIGMSCLAGGKILVYSGLLDRIRLRDDELGLLIGHEIAHALREQVRERLGGQPPSIPLGANPIPPLFGVNGLDGTPATGATFGPPAASTKYDATDETEADVIGADIAARAGFDPRAAVPAWDKLADATRRDKDGFIRAHPYTVARRLDIIKRLPDMLALYAKARGVSVNQLPDYPGMRGMLGTVTRHR